MARAVKPKKDGKPATLAERIRRAVRSGELQLPPLPDVLVRLRVMLNDEAVDAQAVGRLVRNEPAIVALLLKVANSVAYGGLQEVKDLNQAIARLGFKRVGSLVMALTHRQHFRTTDAEIRRMLQPLWDHAVATAIASRRLALQANADGEEAFLAGLLHDTGRLLVLKGIDTLRSDEDEDFTDTLVNELMDALHAELGYEILTSWNLPKPICHAARHHHDDPEESHDRLLLWVQAADLISRKLGAHPQPEPELNLLERPIVEQLRLTDLGLATLLVDIEDEFAEVRSLF